MNQQSKPPRQETIPARAEVPDDAAVRARRLLDASRRSDLSSPVHAIVGVSKRLLADSTAKKIPGFLADIERIHQAGCDILELLDEILDPEQLHQLYADDVLEIIHSRVRHDVLNKLNPVINYSEMWLEDQEHLVKGFLPDLQVIFESGKRCFGLVEAIWSLSNPENTEPAATQLNNMLPDLRDLIPPNRGMDERLCGRVLVADDNESNRDILRRHLQTQGHTVLLAADGRETLDIICAEPVDLVLLDVLMPHTNGFEVLAALKRNPERRDLPVIMISALEDIDIIARSIELGADDYLTKPFNSTVLQARITACLEKHRLREQERIYVAQIQEERRRADDLLHVILPASIVGDLKQTGTTTSRRYDRIGILFADIVDFTPYCERNPPVQVVRTLQRLVEEWEESAVKYHVQKIKTIGDAFMAACGLFEPVENPILACIQCGQEMIEATHALGIGWDLRVGIDFGSAIGGVLGRRQYLFDLWGDTVNIASRMESHGVEGAVVVSDEAWRQVDALFTATPHVRRVKGKGRMRLFRIEGPIEPAAAAPIPSRTLLADEHRD
jgi:class 3 adenylate cyclase/CheY-like chemotaxis protein